MYLQHSDTCQEEALRSQRWAQYKVTLLFLTVVLFTMGFLPQLEDTSEENICFGKSSICPC